MCILLEIITHGRKIWAILGQRHQNSKLLRSQVAFLAKKLLKFDPISDKIWDQAIWCGQSKLVPKLVF